MPKSNPYYNTEEYKLGCQEQRLVIRERLLDLKEDFRSSMAIEILLDELDVRDDDIVYHKGF